LRRVTHGYTYWRTLARWRYALLNGFAEFDRIKKNYTSSAALLSVAIMNLKKTPGGSKAQSKKIGEFAKRNRDYVIREIELISPQVIICGGVGLILKEVINPAGDWRNTAKGLRYFHWNGIPVLDYKHPSHHFLRESNLDAPLVMATKELLLSRG